MSEPQIYEIIGSPRIFRFQEDELTYKESTVNEFGCLGKFKSLRTTNIKAKHFNVNNLIRAIKYFTK